MTTRQNVTAWNIDRHTGRCHAGHIPYRTSHLTSDRRKISSQFNFYGFEKNLHIPFSAVRQHPAFPGKQKTAIEMDSCGISSGALLKRSPCSPFHCRALFLPRRKKTEGSSSILPPMHTRLSS
ncbi:hypothetical protein SAMN05444388_1206 [Flavobacterium johnsoniae]|uniref:Uncharacterized protein n=1 Tax=Flavobacterium johnsoniae TaxID=986 RepID=A0A1M5VU52_FLAJO|nr:hypothetical protein SAMN05444388_1206 [Flavobacterium johnsoniae]